VLAGDNAIIVGMAAGAERLEETPSTARQVQGRQAATRLAAVSCPTRAACAETLAWARRVGADCIIRGAVVIIRCLRYSRLVYSGPESAIGNGLEPAGELETTRSTSEVASGCSRASVSSRCTCVSRQRASAILAAGKPRQRTWRRPCRFPQNREPSNNNSGRLLIGSRSTG
jgi:hypothetical protein